MPIKNRPFFVPKNFEYQPDFYTEFFGDISAVFTHPVKDVTIYLEVCSSEWSGNNGKLEVLYQAADCRMPLVPGTIDSLKDALEIVRLHMKNRTFGDSFKNPPVKDEYNRFIRFFKPEKTKRLRRKGNGKRFVLTEEDKATLRKYGYIIRDTDYDQIEAAANRSTFKVYDADGNDLEVINVWETIDALGRETFLTGIGRSAFHYTCSRENPATGTKVYFDSSILFRNH